MRVVASGYVYDARGAPVHQRSCAHTTATLLRDGTLLVAFRRGSERDSLDGHECLCASTDGGNTWGLRYDGFGKGAWGDTPGEVKGLALAEMTPGELTATGLWVDRSRPELPWINPRTQGLLPMRIFHATSTDGGHTWGPRQRLDTAPHAAASPSSSAVMALPGGVLAQPYEHWKAHDDPSPAQPGARLRRSHDGGQTWPEYVTVAQHPSDGLYYWDERLAVHPETGQLVAMFWTHDPSRQVDRDVHIAWGAPDGRSWTIPVGTGLPGQHCQPLPVGGDRLLAVYTHRHDPPGIRAALSADFGRTWDRAHELLVYDSTVGTESGARKAREEAELWDDMLAWRFGHPRAVLLPTDEVFVTFYAGDDQTKSVHWARLEV